VVSILGCGICIQEKTTTKRGGLAVSSFQRTHNNTHSNLDRRKFLEGAGYSLAAGLLASTAGPATQAQTVTPESIAHAGVSPPMSEKEKLVRIASNTWPIRSLFKTKTNVSDEDVPAMKKKYGEITMLDFPQFTKKTFPGVYQMDLWSGLFGDSEDESQYVETTVMGFDGKRQQSREFDPSTSSSKKWLEKMAATQVKTGTKCHHISNDAPQDISDPDPAKRQAGVDVAKKWLDAAAILGAQSMRVNTGGPIVAPAALPLPGGYASNDALEVYLTNCIASYKEMAEYGAGVGVKVTLENHWGLTANPINMRIIIEEVNNPFCEASPDFCNWENKYLLYHALQDLAPYAHTTVHAKFWDRFDKPDVQRNVRIMLNNNFTGVFALEYEAGPWDGVEGAQHLFQEVLAAM
jgi:Xylose isomerase-like TIM barrel